MNKSLYARISGAVALGAVLSPAIGVGVSAEAAQPVRISAVQYDSPGSDTGGNRSLNAEWVRITNHGSRKRVLTDWTLRDAADHVYRFGTFALGPGQSVRVHTGSGRNTRTDRYWGSGWYIWNNDHDRATLKNRRGIVVSRASW